jgi:hypothetical protein
MSVVRSTVGPRGLTDMSAETRKRGRPPKSDAKVKPKPDDIPFTEEMLATSNQYTADDNGCRYQSTVPLSEAGCCVGLMSFDINGSSLVTVVAVCYFLFNSSVLFLFLFFCSLSLFYILHVQAFDTKTVSYCVATVILLMTSELESTPFPRQTVGTCLVALCFRV